MTRFALRLILAVVVCSLFASSVEARKWTSRDGKFSMEGEFVEAIDGKVKLRRADGMTVDVPLDKLSVADNAYVQEELQKRGKNVVPPMPTKPNEPASGSPAPNSGKSNWRVVSDPCPDPLVLPENHTIDMPISGGSRSIVIYPTSTSSIVALGEEQGRNKLIKIYDLRKGAYRGELEAPLIINDKYDITPDGKYAITESRKTFRSLEIWSFETGKLVRALETPKSRFNTSILRFAGNQLVLVLTREKRMLAFAVPSGTLKWETELAVEERQHLAISPGGNFIAHLHQNVIQIIDARNGRLAGTIEMPIAERSRLESLAFSQDGSELAVFTQVSGKRIIDCFDMKKGNRLVTHELKDVLGSYGYDGNKLEWLADKSGWSIYGNSIVDYKLGGPVWTLPIETRDYGANSPQQFVDAKRKLVVTGKRNELKLKLMDLPKQEIAQGAISFAANNASGKGGTNPPLPGDGSLPKESEIEDPKLPPLIMVDLAETKQQQLPTSSTWSYRPSIIKPNPTIQWDQPVWKMPAGECFSAHFSRADVGRVVIGTIDLQRPIAAGGHINRSFEVFDLVSSKSLSKWEAPFNTELKAVSPAGQLGAFMKHGSNRIEIFDLIARKHVVSFRSNDSSQRAAAPSHLRCVGFASDTCLLILDSSNELVAYDIPSCKVVYRVSILANHCMLTADRATVAVVGNSQLALLDSLTGQIRGMLAKPTKPGSIPPTSIALRDDGSSLAALYEIKSSRVLVTWKLSNGEVEKELTFGLPYKEVSWVGPRHVLLHHHSERRGVTADLDEFYTHCSLVDLDKEGVRWTYNTTEGVKMVSGFTDRQWYLAKGSTPADWNLVAVSLPDKAVTNVIANAPQDEKPLLGPNCKTSLKIDAVGYFAVPAAGKPKPIDKIKSDALAKMTAALEAQGMKVEEKAPVTIQVRMYEVSATNAENLLKQKYLNPPIWARMKPDIVVIEIKVAEFLSTPAWQATHIIEPNEMRKAELLKAGLGKAFDDRQRAELWNDATTWLSKAQIPTPMYRLGVSKGAGESVLDNRGQRIKR